MKSVGLFLTLFVLSAAGCASPDGPVGTEDAPTDAAWSPVADLSTVDGTDWIRLFNRTDLAGWTPKVRGFEAGDDPQGTFSVQNGAITVSYGQYGGVFREQFGHLFHEVPYGWYHLEVEYRFTGDQIADGPGWAWRNSGIMVHGQSAASMGLDQDFPISIEVQLLGGDGAEPRTTANLCTPGTNVVYQGQLDTRHCIESASETFAGDRWVRVGVTVLGDSLIVHSVEGEEVLRYENPQIGGGNVDGADPALLVEGLLLDSGTISLQSESHPVQFRRVDLLPLEGCMDPASAAFRPYFLKSDPAACAIRE